MEEGGYIKEQGRVCRGDDNEHIRGEEKCITLGTEEVYQGLRKEGYIKEGVGIYYEERETTSHQQTQKVYQERKETYPEGERIYQARRQAESSKDVLSVLSRDEKGNIKQEYALYIEGH